MSKMMSEMYDKVTTQQFAAQFNQQLPMSHAMGLQLRKPSNASYEQQGYPTTRLWPNPGANIPRATDVNGTDEQLLPGGNHDACASSPASAEQSISD